MTIMINRGNLDILKVKPTGFPEGTDMSKYKKKRINAVFSLGNGKIALPFTEMGKNRKKKNTSLLKKLEEATRRH